MHESCHTRMSHVTQEWVMSHKNESCHTRMSHVTQEWVMSHKNELCHTRMSYFTKACAVWTSHVTHETVLLNMHESCHIAMSHVTESCHTGMSHITQEWVMLHRNESCHTGMSQFTQSCAIWMSPVTHEVGLLNTVQEASWWWDFDPVYIILFDLYYQLRTNVLSNLYHDSVSRGRYPLVPRGRVRHPLDSKKLFVRFMSHVTHSYESCHWVISRRSESLTLSHIPYE